MRSTWQKNGIIRAIAAAAAGTFSGYLWLMLTLPFMVGIFVSNELSVMLHVRDDICFGLATGLILSVPPALIAALVATRLAGGSLHGQRLASLAIAVTVGTITGVATSTALWVLVPLKASSQGPPILHIANWSCIAIAALSTALLVGSLAGRRTANSEPSDQRKRERSVARTALLGALLLWAPTAVLGEVGWIVYITANQTGYYVRQLDSDDSFQRFLAIRWLIESRAFSPEVSAAVSKCLHDDDPQVREKARDFLQAAAEVGGTFKP